MIDQLINLARKHPGFREISDYGLRVMFETYKDTMLIHKDNGEIKAFAIYQEWPDRLNFIAVVGGSDDRLENLFSLLKIKGDIPPEKMVCYFDEARMELKILCHQSQL
jgi:hypothetical protein